MFLESTVDDVLSTLGVGRRLRPTTDDGTGDDGDLHAALAAEIVPHFLLALRELSAHRRPRLSKPRSGGPRELAHVLRIHIYRARKLKEMAASAGNMAKNAEECRRTRQPVRAPASGKVGWHPREVFRRGGWQVFCRQRWTYSTGPRGCRVP